MELSYRNHKKKAWTKINILKKLKFTLDRHSLEIIYFTFIRPLLEYADVIWGNCTNSDKLDLDKIQYEAARIVTGATKLISINDLLVETKWETLASRRRKHRLVLVYKMINGHTPEYLNNLVPPRNSELSSYNLRNQDDIQLIRSRTTLFHNSFFPATIVEWNLLQLNVRNSATINIFKHLISPVRQTVPNYYHVGSRQSQILHCRLRTQCSSLNQHLHRKNIIDSNLCSCGLVESSHHYFFFCRKYTVIRETLLLNIRQLCPNITLDLLLHGNSNVSDTINSTIFQHVHIYIRESNRFR